MNYDQNNQGIRAIITILYENILVTTKSHIATEENLYRNYWSCFWVSKKIHNVNSLILMSPDFLKYQFSFRGPHYVPQTWIDS